nr:hypothetical protein [Desulfobacula sp.]
MEQRVFMDGLDTARFVCPECGREKIMQLSAYDIQKHATRVRVKCKCGHSRILILEKMVEGPKSMPLTGTFTAKGRERVSGKMIIKNSTAKASCSKPILNRGSRPA